MIALPSKQRGGVVSIAYAVEGASSMRSAIGNTAMKLQVVRRFADLPKSKQDLWAHGTLAAGGGLLAVMGMTAIAGSDMTPQDLKEYAGVVTHHFNDVSTPNDLKIAFMNAAGDVWHAMPEPMQKVTGTTLTGVLNCVRNLGQIHYMRDVDVSTKEGRQDRRNKQFKSNIISAGTNMPQLIEGVLLGDWKRISAAGIAVGSYGTRALRYKIMERKKAKGENYNPPYILEDGPTDAMLPRGLAQANVATEILPEFGLLATVFQGAGGACQFFGAGMMKISDQKKLHENGGPKPELS